MQQPVARAADIEAAHSVSYVQWGAVFAGALAAAATSLVLLTFGSAIGLSVASPTPSWREASTALALLSGLWVLLVTVGSLALGGYIAGRMRSSWSVTHDDEVEFRDGVHGLVVWALAVLIGAVLAALTAGALIASMSGEDGDAAAGASAPSVQAGLGRAFPLSYEVDRLFRAERRPAEADPEARAEAGRLLAAALSQSTPPAEDRAQLVRLVSARTGLAQPEAERRVDTVIADARRKLRAARRAAIILAFMTAASLLAGVAAAWFAAGIGGRHRDTAAPPSLAWGVRTIRVT